MYEKLVRAEWSCFAKKKRSDITNAFTNEIVRVASGTVFFLKIISQALLAVFQLAVAFMMSVPMTGFVLLCGVLVLIYMNSTFRESKKLGGSLRLINQELLSRIMEQLNGVKEAKSYGIEEDQIASFENITEKNRRNLTDFTRLQSKTTMIYKICAAVIICLLFYTAVVFLKTEPAALLIIIFIFARLWPSFTSLQSNVQHVIAMMPSYTALKALTRDLDLHKETMNPASETAITGKNASIQFENVGFRYDDASSFELKGLNFEILASGMTAFIGESGAGKSTIIDLLMGLLKPTEGRIMVDGVEINESNMFHWRKRFGYVPQDPFLFNSTIKENLLRFTPEATEEELMEALRLSAALEFVERLPEGTDTVIGDGGIRLSGGERQRIVLARALLRRPQILVLDEATSSLDNENEFKIQKAVESLSEKMAVVVIAHRLSTIKNADNIIIVSGGLITMQGTYEELLAKKGNYLSKSLEIYQ